MPDNFDLAQATAALNNPNTPPSTLAQIAQTYPNLWVGVASHPAAYPDLLAWLDSVGDYNVKAAVAARRQAMAAPPMPAPPMYYAAQPPAKSSGVNKTAIIIVAVALVVIVAVVAAIVFVPRLTGGGGGGGTDVPTPMPTATATTSQTPDKAPPQPTFLDGFKTLATISDPGGLVGSTDDKVIAYQFGDLAHPMAIDKATGDTLWTTGGACDSVIDGKAMACFAPDDIDSNKGTYQWVSVADGQSQGDLDMSDLGTYIYDHTDTSHGVLLLAGNTDVFTNFDTGTISATIGYYTGPGQPQWTAKVKFVFDMTDAYDSFDEGSGLFAWNALNQIFILDQTTGYMAYQSEGYRSQVFSNRFVCLGYDSVTKPVSRKQVQVPGQDPVTVATCGGEDDWMPSYTTSHPDVILMASLNGTSAYDPATGIEGGAIWQSGNAWPGIQSIAWDGDQTAYALAQDGTVWAFDVTTGNQLWTTKVQGAANIDFATMDLQISLSASLLMVSGYVINDDSTHGLAFFRADNGQPIDILGNSNSDNGQLKDGALFIWYLGSSNADIIVPTF